MVNRRMMLGVRFLEEKESEGECKKSDPPLLPPLGRGRKGGPYNHNAGEG